ncbi:hypothetical protein ACLB1E_29415 [Escherichia coli]
MDATATLSPLLTPCSRSRSASATTCAHFPIATRNWRTASAGASGVFAAVLSTSALKRGLECQPAVALICAHSRTSTWQHNIDIAAQQRRIRGELGDQHFQAFSMLD